MASLEADTTISHYKIKGLIGSGGMGEVYKAIDLQLGRVVALKMILPVRAADPNMYQRFLREARAASILTHPGICTIYEIGQADDLTFIAMQFLEGKTLQTIITDYGAPPIETTVNYAVDIVDALEEAHRNGVIHRDIKPANILINERNAAVMLDFGLAKQVTFAAGLNEELPTQMQITSTATLVGTGPYMPPEQIMGEPLDARSDIFSFGVTLYESLTGVRPFGGRHSVDVLHSILHDEPKPIKELRPEVDEELTTIVAKAMNKNREDRYQSAGDMRADLMQLIQTKGYAFRGFSGSLSASLAAGLKRPDFRTQEIPTATGPMVTPRAYVWPAVITMGLVVLIAAGWWIYRASNRSDTDLVTSLRHAQLVNWRSEPGESYIHSSLSRDGTMIAYSASRDGVTDIWVKQTLGEANPIRIATGLNPMWSPDNQQIAFVASRNNETGIWRVPALGGSPALIKVVEKGAPELVSWSTKLPVLYYSTAHNLFAVNVESGQIQQVTSLDNSSVAQYFSLSPDEDRVSYIDERDEQFDIWILPRTGGAPARLTNDAAEEKSVVWHPDGKRLIYSSLRDDVYQVFVANVDGSKPVQITFGENDSFVSSVSGDGKKILYSSPREESDIWGVKVDSGEEVEITASAGVEIWPDASPDGKLIAFQTTTGSQGRNLDASALMIKTINEGQPLRLSVRGQDPRWSPDGSRLALISGSGKERNLWLVNPTGSGVTQLTKDGISALGITVLPYNRTQARAYSWSSDSKKILYSRETQSGEHQICMISADDTGESRILARTTSGDLYSPMWSPDSKRVAYYSRSAANSSEGKLWKILLTDTETGKSEVVYQGDHLLRLLGWSGADELMFVTDERARGISAKPTEITLWQLHPGEQPKSVALLNSAYLHNFQLSPNGKTIAFASHQDSKENIWLIPTTGGLPKRVTANSDPRFYFSSLTWAPDGKLIYYGKQSAYNLISEMSGFK